MGEVSSQVYRDRLKGRRDKIMMTLAHVREQQRAVDDNKDWIDQAAYASRIKLLDSLIGWYQKETTSIDDALRRIAEGKYGLCVACHSRIDALRLETSPEAAFCTKCQNAREALGTCAS